MPRGYASGPFGQVHYFDAGGEGPALLLLPQAPMTLRQFDSVYGLFRERNIRAIGIDPPGFGNSDPPPFVPMIADWASVVPAVMDQLSLNEASLAGHHTGALVAAEFSVQHPDRTQSLIMHGALLVADEERRQRLHEIEVRERQFEFKSDGSHLTDLFAIRRRLSEGRIPPELLTRYVVEQLMGRGPFWHGHHAAYMYDLESRLASLPDRTLVITNTGDLIHDQTRRVLQLEPRLHFAELIGGGVDIIDEQPGEWTATVARFLTARSLTNA